MESLLIHPQGPNQLEQIKTSLKSIKVAFQIKTSGLPGHVVEGIKKAIAEDDADKTISFEEFRNKHFLSK